DRHSRRPPEATPSRAPLPLLLDELLLRQLEFSLDPRKPLGFLHPKLALALARLALVLGAAPPLLFVACAADFLVAGPLLGLNLGPPFGLLLRSVRVGLRLHPFVFELPQLFQREQDGVLWTVGLRQQHLGRLLVFGRRGVDGCRAQKIFVRMILRCSAGYDVRSV